MTDQPRLLKYVVLFSLVYLTLMIVVGVALSFLDISGNSGISIGALVGGTVYAISRFLRDTGRLFTESEKWIMIFSCLAASLVLSAIPAVLFLLFTPDGHQVMNALSDMEPSFWALIIGFSLLLNFIALWLAFGFLARRMFAALQKRGDLSA